MFIKNYSVFKFYVFSLHKLVFKYTLMWVDKIILNF
jgi:hypothetical protein